MLREENYGNATDAYSAPKMKRYVVTAGGDRRLTYKRKRKGVAADLGE